MQVFYCDHFVLPLPTGHRFPMEKYALLRERVAEAGPSHSLRMGVPDGASDEQLERVHDRAYVRAVVDGALGAQEVRRIGFPWSRELVERSRRSVGGTIAATHAALDDGAAANLAGGTHHAFPSHGEGFCVFNDVAVAIQDLRAQGRLRRVAVVDLDVHQGNGTAAIFANDPDVFTLSVHGESNYPFHKATSSLDIGLPDQTGDEEFLDAVERGVHAAVDESRPELVVYIAGADAYEGDRLGRLSVSKKGMFARDRIVFSRASSLGLPVAVVMAGGYAADVQDTVDIHHHSVLTALEYGRTGVGT